MSFTGVNPAGAIGATATKGASTGAPSASLVTMGNNSWVLGVGNDFDKATARTVGAGQVLIHQYLTSTGDTYWVQMLGTPIAASGTAVTINDTAPTKDSYNLAIVEILSDGSSGTPVPPTVSMTSPASNTTVSSLVDVSASASDPIAVEGVQFLLDGAPLGAQLTSQPYSFSWDSTTAPSGTHTLSAIATNS